MEQIPILFVAFEFPPLGGAGVQRSLKFVKYLSEYQIHPIVITVQEDDYQKIMPEHPIDFSLCRDIPSTVIIERIHCPAQKISPNNKLKSWSSIFFSVVENFNHLWRPALKRKLPELIGKYQPKAIYVSLPPFAMAPLWLDLLKSYEIPLIADFRDAWSQWCVSPNASWIHYRIKLAIEDRFLRRADHVICSSNQIMKDMIRVHPSLDIQKFSVINNGFDAELHFANQLTIGKEEKLIIGYVGSFYYSPESRDQIFKPWWKKPPHRMIQYIPRKEDWLYRSPYFFFKAVADAIKNTPAIQHQIEIRFAGKTPSWLKDQIKEFGLEGLCKHYGYLDHDAVISFQEHCNLLLITSSKVLGGRDYSIAGKTYEYFTVGKPILAFVCEGEQKDILEESGMAIICDPDEAGANAQTIENIFKQGLVLYPNKSNIEKYHRKRLTEKLAGIIKKI